MMPRHIFIKIIFLLYFGLILSMIIKIYVYHALTIINSENLIKNILEQEDHGKNVNINIPLRESVIEIETNLIDKTKIYNSKNILKPSNKNLNDRELKIGEHQTNIDASDVYLSDREIVRIKKEIKIRNEEQIIYNADVYDPLTSNDTVIIIQVHKGLEALKYLVESLTNAKYINTSLVIFSHDLWDEEINSLIRSISAFKVMQIFYPYTLQLHPFKYPGTDPRDCSENQREIEKVLSKYAKRPQCLNSNWPDVNGSFRRASLTQSKQHWLWKLVHVFEKIRHLNNFTGQVLFLEEDHYVTPDILHVLKLLVKERDAFHKSYNIFSLGNNHIFKSNAANVIRRGDWIGGLGFAFNRSIYNVIKECQSDYCSYDDLNWSFTIHFMAATCAFRKFSMLSTIYTRVHQISNNEREKVSKVQELIKKASADLFPKSVVMKGGFIKAWMPENAFGGWGDYRDMMLCLTMANSTSEIEALLDKLQFPDVSIGESVTNV